MTDRTGPLANLTIVDCTMALAGPFGTALLADMGADIIKIEPPHGDGSRAVPPLPPDYANATADEQAGVDYGGYFASINRNKRSVVLDLKLPADREALLRLCEQADIIKIEPPHGDGSRAVPPLPPDYANAAADEQAGVDYGGYFASINRNKRSVVLDLKLPADREALLRLCEQADAIVENMRVGVMDRLGVGYDVIRERNPKIVYGALRGFGDPRTGKSPYAEWPAYDIVAQSMGGLAHITGPPDAGGYPCGVSVGDIYPGTMLALGLLAAVNHAHATGEGQFFDVGMYDAMLAFNETVVANYGYTQTELGPRGQHHPNLMPFGIFPTRDGAVAIAAPGPGHWKALCVAMAREDLIDDERTQNTFVRRRNQEFVEGAISAWTAQRTKQEVVDRLGGTVPCGPVNTAADIFADPHVEARNMITRFDLPGDNPEVAIVGSPVKFERSPAGFYRRPPTLGEHTDEVIAEFDLRDHTAD